MEGCEHGGVSPGAPVKEEPDFETYDASIKEESIDLDECLVKEEPTCESSTGCASETGWGPAAAADRAVKESVPGPGDGPRVNEPNTLQVDNVADALPRTADTVTCGQTFLKKDCLIDQLKMHLQENSETMPNADESSLLSHESSDTHDKKYPCKICKKEFRKGYLKIHERGHTSGKPYTCEVCNKKYAVWSSLIYHKRVHTEESPYTCGICKKSFADATTLRRHKQCHSNEKPYICEICQRGFRHSHHLRSHIGTHTGEKPYSCTICNKQFRQSKSLKDHEIIHSSENPISCEICNKQFTRLRSLKGHKIIHTQENPFSCEICKKRFPKLSTLEGHKIIHTQVNPLSCEMCKKDFMTKSSYENHKRKHEEVFRAAREREKPEGGSSAASCGVSGTGARGDSPPPGAAAGPRASILRGLLTATSAPRETAPSQDTNTDAAHMDTYVQGNHSTVKQSSKRQIPMIYVKKCSRN